MISLCRQGGAAAISMWAQRLKPTSTPVWASRFRGSSNSSTGPSNMNLHVKHPTESLATTSLQPGWRVCEDDSAKVQGDAAGQITVESRVWLLAPYATKEKGALRPDAGLSDQKSPEGRDARHHQLRRPAGQQLGVPGLHFSSSNSHGFA